MIRKLATDSISSGMVPLLKICITFVMAPVIVHALGNYDYGISEIIASVVGYMGILDLGLMPAIVRFVARHKALNDEDSLHKIFSTALAFLFPVGLLLTIFLVSASFYAPHIFAKAAADGSKYGCFLAIVGIQVFFTFVGAIFDCYLEGLQYYKTRNFTTMVFSLAGAVVLYNLLKNGGGLLSVAIVNGIGYSVKNLLYGFLLCQRSFGGFRFRIDNVSRRVFKDLFSFGIKSLVYSVSLRVSTLTDSLVIGKFLGAASVPFYVIPVSFLSHARNLVWAMTRNFMPAFAELHAISDVEKIRELFFSCSRYAVGAIAPMVGGICILGPPFLSTWMGREYAEKGTIVLYLIASSYMLQWLNPFSNRFLTATAKHAIMAKLGILNAMLNIGLSLIFVRYLGIEGVALGTLLPTAVFEPFLLHKTCRELGTDIFRYGRHVLAPILIPIIVFVVSLKMMILIYPPSSLPSVMLLAGAAVLLYVPVFMCIAMTGEERAKLYVFASSFR